MNQKILLNSPIRFWLTLLIVLPVLITSCYKQAVKDIPSKLPGLPTIAQMLDSIPDFKLFNAAMKKAGADSILSSSDLSTVFCLKDADMIAGGLDQQTIQTLSADSLMKIMLYHIANGALAEDYLKNAGSYIHVLTRRRDVSFTSQAGFKQFKHMIYVKIKDGKLYINAKLCNDAPEVIQASNGLLYTIKAPLRPAEKTIYDELSSRPELSYYKAAIDILDSLYRVDRRNINSFPRKPWPIEFFTATSDDLQRYLNLSVDYNNIYALPTVLAPVNDAFIDAGFATIDDIRAYIRRTTIANLQSSRYAHLDSTLRAHIIFNRNNRASDLLFSDDILSNQQINNGIYNMNYYSSIINPWGGLDDSYTIFSVNGSEVNIRPSTREVFTPARMLMNGRDIFTKNGIIHEIDKLFFPIQD